MPLYKMKDKSGKLIKKDGLQKYRVRINYVDDYGKPKQIDRVAFGLDEAKVLEMELSHGIKQNNMPISKTVGTLFEEYIAAKQHEVRESSLDKTERILKDKVLPTFENTKLDKLSIQMIEKWKQELNTKNLSTTTKKNIYGEFRALINYAVKMQYISKNPVSLAGNFKAPLELKKEMLYYTADEFLKFIAVAREQAYKTEKEKSDLYEWNYYVFFNIAFYCGLRKGEIYALTWEDIKDGYVSITKSIAQKLKGSDRLTPPKNKSSIRTIQIPQPLQSVLDEHLKRCQTIDGFSTKQYICGGDKPIRDASLTKRNNLYAELAGVKHIRIHDFRHSHASLLANEGINIQEIARRLGHSKISTTWETYAHLYPKEEERAVNVLNRVK